MMMKLAEKESEYQANLQQVMSRVETLEEENRFLRDQLAETTLLLKEQAIPNIQQLEMQKLLQEELEQKVG
jgi:uncharacterized protein (UPF0335 family)